MDLDSFGEVYYLDVLMMNLLYFLLIDWLVLVLIVLESFFKIGESFIQTHLRVLVVLIMDLVISNKLID